MEQEESLTKNVVIIDDNQKNRIREFDLARVLAIIFMVCVHLEYAIYDFGNDIFWKVFDFLGSPFAAPVFMFVLGGNIILSRHNSPKELFDRGWKLFLFSLLFNIICHALPFFILAAINNSTEYLQSAIHWIFAVDILTFSGLAFMFFAFVRKFNVNKFILIAFAIGSSIVNILLTDNLQIDFYSNIFLAATTSLFYCSSITGYFSFLGWIIFPIAGYVFIDCYLKIKNKNKFYLILGSVCLIIFTIMLIFSGHAVNGGPVIDFNDEYAYYKMPPYGSIMAVAFCLLWISIIFFASKKVQKGLLKHIKRWNKNLTIIYVCQWFIINYFFVLLSNNTCFVGEWLFIVCSLCVIVLADVFAFLIKKYIIKKIEQKRLKNKG